MSSRQENIRFKILPDMTLRAFNAATYKSDSISEWLCNFVGNPCNTLTTSIPKLIEYEW